MPALRPWARWTTSSTWLPLPARPSIFGWPSRPCEWVRSERKTLLRLRPDMAPAFCMHPHRSAMAIRSASTNGRLLGQCQPGGPALGLRRSQALCRGAGHGLPPLARRQHAPGPHLQHLWPAAAPQRRPRDLELHDAGPAGRAADDLWGWQPDPKLLLCGRSDRGHSAARRVRTNICR